MTKHTKDEVISIRLSSRMLERLRRVLNRDGEKISEFVRLATMQRLERREREGG